MINLFIDYKNRTVHLFFKSRINEIDRKFILVGQQWKIFLLITPLGKDVEIENSNIENIKIGLKKVVPNFIEYTIEETFIEESDYKETIW